MRTPRHRCRLLASLAALCGIASAADAPPPPETLKPPPDWQLVWSDEFDVDGLHVEVMNVERRRINKVRITKLADKPLAESEHAL